MAAKQDLVDRLIADWAREMPELSTGAMGIVGRILHLGQIFEARTNKLLKPFGINYTDLDILATLRRSGKPYRLAPKALLNSVLITSGAMTAALDRLTNEKLITRIPSREDRRSRSAQLTVSGAKLVENVIGRRFEEAENSLANVSKSDRRALTVLLRKVMLAVDELPPQA